MFVIYVIKYVEESIDSIYYILNVEYSEHRIKKLIECLTPIPIILY